MDDARRQTATATQYMPVYVAGVDGCYEAYGNRLRSQRSTSEVRSGALIQGRRQWQKDSTMAYLEVLGRYKVVRVVRESGSLRGGAKVMRVAGRRRSCWSSC